MMAVADLCVWVPDYDQREVEDRLGAQAKLGGLSLAGPQQLLHACRCRCCRDIALFCTVPGPKIVLPGR